ncbi:uncharacterized protein TA17845 [Theileria annulata]|uniref:Uncharacterized protein n=1 Tax=Theileria annulata TaxID=5874 RepID=Q4UB76_THEAN|nr:uncharacterized protein TA17845 [Theileria annulata]CAI75925.1 hypothetical protein TA17845 [Theileria annulata]|eukprot:XP_955401.1 hypothetical protein TA17845 [Theileria annulata]
MINHIEENGSITLDEFTQSIISQKIFNIDENEVLTKLASAIKDKFSNLYDNTYLNIFDRSALSDCTYKSHLNLLFSVDANENERLSSFKSAPGSRQPSTILNWFKRDTSKYETSEKKVDIQECVNDQSDEEHSKKLVPIDIDEFGTLVISADMISFSSDSDADTDFEIVDLNTISGTSIPVREFDCLGEDDDTFLETASVNNCSTGDNLSSDGSKCSDLESVMADIPQDPDSDDIQPISANLEDCIHEPPKPPYSKYNLGNNVFVFYGNSNNFIGSYWVLTKVFDCDFKTLFATQNNLGNESIVIYNRKVQHFDCKILQELLTNEVLSLVKLKELLLTRHNKVTILENFEYLSGNWQVFMNKWFDSMHEKVFILLCNRLNKLDSRIKSFSLMFRIGGLDKHKFIDYIHRMSMKNANNNIKGCLSRLNVTEIVNRVDFDIIMTYNTVIEAQKNYMNAIRKHKIPYGHKLLRNLVHIILRAKTSEQIDSTINNLISDIFLDYGPYKLDVMLYDFYTRLIEMGNHELVPLKFGINHLLSKVNSYNIHVYLFYSIFDQHIYFILSFH